MDDVVSAGVILTPALAERGFATISVNTRMRDIGAEEAQVAQTIARWAESELLRH